MNDYALPTVTHTCTSPNWTLQLQWGFGLVKYVYIRRVRLSPPVLPPTTSSKRNLSRGSVQCEVPKSAMEALSVSYLEECNMGVGYCRLVNHWGEVLGVSGTVRCLVRVLEARYYYKSEGEGM